VSINPDHAETSESAEVGKSKQENQNLLSLVLELIISVE
jgi:hypothetical protein